jgi:plasmid maintenance system antidote protein VapI
LKRIYITNHKKLAEVVGITRQHLSSVKNKQCGASDELLCELERVTDIQIATWLIPSRKITLAKELTAFFESEKYAESRAIIKTRRDNNDAATLIRS